MYPWELVSVGFLAIAMVTMIVICIIAINIKRK